VLKLAPLFCLVTARTERTTPSTGFASSGRSSVRRVGAANLPAWRFEDHGEGHSESAQKKAALTRWVGPTVSFPSVCREMGLEVDAISVSSKRSVGL